MNKPPYRTEIRTIIDQQGYFRLYAVPMNYNRMTHRELGKYLLSVTTINDWKREHIDVYRRGLRDGDEIPTDYLIETHDIPIQLIYQLGDRGHLRIFQF